MIHSAVILLWLGLCALQDMRQRQIANSLTLGVALLALIYLLWRGTTWLGAPAGDGGWAFAVALLLTLPGYALDRFGAGDVKLLAALALASNLDALLWSLIGAAVFQGAWVLIHQRFSAHREVPSPGVSTKQPFAPFVLTGFVLYWLWIH
ncbi:prepilin peptidase [Pseudomonas canadensis]|uniref:prepilin peptidase n=1 Tax=Pseudomonas canadensis TaxID=915099 RepID=UPI00273711CA|nr:prepilin peptidase [Pseudomonas canadensis]WLH30722.1 prepilin peptidase [Pseudomonas canadensis]